MIKILKYLKPYKMGILIIFILLVTQAYLELLLPAYMARIVDIGLQTGDVYFILNQGLSMVFITIIALTCTICASILAAKIATSFAKELRLKMFDKVINFSDTERDEFSTATLITRTTQDINQIQNFLAMLLRLVIFAPILAIGGIIKVIRTGASASFIIAIAVICILILTSVIFRLAIIKFELTQKLNDKVNLITRESLTGIMVVRAFGRQKHEEEKFKDVNEKLMKNNLSINRLVGLFFPAIMIIMNFSTIGIIWFSSYEIYTGELQLGEMMALIDYSAQIINAFLLMSFAIIIFVRGSVSANRILEVLNSETTIKSPENPKKFDNNITGEIIFENVYFKYPEAKDYTLENISFKVSKGETIAFIGGTGSGKSTITKLLLRFYDVTSGSIYVDGINIKDACIKDLREKFGYVPQKGVLFSGTIESNVKFGNDKITQEDIIKATEISQSKSFIDKKENKLKEEITQGGTNVSGGQRQRLAIARAIAKDAQVLIFDDSFSALDYKTDLQLRRAIGKQLKGKTYMIIGQRVNTVKEANTIIVLEDGKIIGNDTHENLILNCNVYKEISKSQA
jgi:ATP-binding cassette, subfamily B, multidrug efflux pump